MAHLPGELPFRWLDAPFLQGHHSVLQYQLICSTETGMYAGTTKDRHKNRICRCSKRYQFFPSERSTSKE